MSMILDALSRAEKERQQDTNVYVDPTRYTTTSTIKEERFKKWVLIALVANLSLITIFATGYFWQNYNNEQATSSSSMGNASVVEQSNMHETKSQPTNNVVADSQEMNQALVQQRSDVPEVDLVSQQVTTAVEQVKLNDQSNFSAQTLSLLDEAQVQKAKPVISSKKKPAANKTIKSSIKKVPPVQYASKPLSHDGVAQITNNTPTVASINEAVRREQLSNTSSYTNLSDLPVSQRAQLSQYEVNVHVYDNNPSSRFVLINMVKYKQGDRISGTNTNVSSIVPEGVVLNHNGQQVLLERNQ